MMKNPVTTIVKATMEMPFTVPYAGHFLAAIKPELMKIGFRSYPVLTFVAPPGHGKTVMMSACLCGDYQMIPMWKKYKEIQKMVEKNPNAHLSADDFAAFKAAAQKEKAARAMDELTRQSYAGDGAVLSITIESQAMARLPESCQQRMLPVDVTRFWTPKNKKMAKILNDYRQTTEKLVAEFGEWVPNQEIDYRRRLAAFEFKHAARMVGNSREVYSVFAVVTAMDIFYQFIKEVYPAVYEECFDNVDEFLDDLEMQLFDARKTAKQHRAEVFQKAFEDVLNGQNLAVQKPEVKYGRCVHYSRGECVNCTPFRWGFDTVECDEYAYNEVNGRYDYRDMILDRQYNSVFLPDIGDVIDFPKHLRNLGKHPVLIIGKDLLVQQINEQVMRRCAKEEIKEDVFSTEEVTRYLYRLGMAFYVPGAKGRRYSMKYYRIGDEGENDGALEAFSVIIVRLTAAQAEALGNRTPSYSPLPFCQNYAKPLYKEVKGRWASLTLSGAVGEYSDQ